MPFARHSFRYLAIVLPLVLVACVFTRDPNSVANPDPNHVHADFAVWIDGQQWDFSAERYMSEAPVSAVFFSPFVSSAYAHDHEEGTVPNPKRQYLHLHDGNGYVMHSHKSGHTLRDFFESLNWGLGYGCVVTDIAQTYCVEGDKRWRMGLNGAEITWSPDYVFVDLDRILLSYGSADAAFAEQMSALTDDACLYSKRCPWRGDPPAENCIADPAVPCVEVQ